jgi:hypothetical protein
MRNLNKRDKVLLGLFIFLIIAVIITGFKNRPNDNNSQSQNSTQTASTTNRVSKITSNVSNQSVTSPTNALCHIRSTLPDAKCTPGAIDPRVTQSNIKQTICMSGYTKTVRPSSNYTTKLKIQQINAYGYTDTNKADYEEDHLISLELGGSPSDTKNLWPEPGPSPNPKDKVENKLHSLVCNGVMQLVVAQKRIATDWLTALKGY